MVHHRLFTTVTHVYGIACVSKQSLWMKRQMASSAIIFKCKQQNWLQPWGGKKQKTAGELKENPWNLFQGSWTVRFTIYWRGGKKATWKRLIHMFSIAEVIGKGRLRMGNHRDCDQRHVTRSCLMSTFRPLLQLSRRNKSENQKQILHQQRCQNPFRSLWRLIFQWDMWRRADILSVNDTQTKTLSNLNVTLLFLAVSPEKLSDDQ